MAKRLKQCTTPNSCRAVVERDGDHYAVMIYPFVVTLVIYFVPHLMFSGNSPNVTHAVEYERYDICADGKNTYSDWVWEDKFLKALADDDTSKLQQILADYSPGEKSAKTLEEAGYSKLKLDLDGWGARIYVSKFVDILKRRGSGFNVSIGFGSANSSPLPQSIQRQQDHLGLWFFGVMNGNVHLYVTEAVYIRLYGFLNEPARPHKQRGMTPSHAIISRSMCDFIDMLEKAAGTSANVIQVVLVSYGAKLSLPTVISCPPNDLLPPSYYSDEPQQGTSEISLPIDIEYVVELFDASIDYRFQIAATSKNEKDTHTCLLGYNLTDFNLPGVNVYTVGNVVQAIPAIVETGAVNDGNLESSPPTMGCYGTVTLTDEALASALRRDESSPSASSMHDPLCQDETRSDGLNLRFYHKPVGCPGQNSEYQAYKALSSRKPGDSGDEDYVRGEGAIKMVCYNNQMKHHISNHSAHLDDVGKNPKQARKRKVGERFVSTDSEGAQNAITWVERTLSNIELSHDKFPAQWIGGPRFELSVLLRGGRGTALEELRLYGEAVMNMADSSRTGVYCCAKVEIKTILSIARSLLSLARKDKLENMGWRAQEIMSVLGWVEPSHRQARHHSRHGVTVHRALLKHTNVQEKVEVNTERGLSSSGMDFVVLSDRIGVAVDFFQPLLPCLRNVNRECTSELVTRFTDDFPYENQSFAMSIVDVPDARNVSLYTTALTGGAENCIYVSAPEIYVHGRVFSLTTAMGPHPVVTASSEVFIVCIQYFNMVRKLPRSSMKRTNQLRKHLPNEKGSLFPHKNSTTRLRRQERTDQSAFGQSASFYARVTAMPFFRLVLDPIIQKYNHVVEEVVAALASLDIQVLSVAEKDRQYQLLKETVKVAENIAIRYREAVYDLLIARYFVKYSIFQEKRWSHPCDLGEQLGFTLSTFRPSRIMPT